MRIAWGERVGCKSRFALVFKNSAGRRCGFRVKMRGTSSLHGKLTGDFGNASEAGRISDCLPSRVFTKKQSLCNFRLLQQNLPGADNDGGNVAGKVHCFIASAPAALRVSSMKVCATGLSVRFFSVTMASGLGVDGSSIGSAFIVCLGAGNCSATRGIIDR